MNPKNDDGTGHIVGRGVRTEWEYQHPALAKLAARPRKEVVSAHHSLGGVKLKLYPVHFFQVTVRPPADFHAPSVRQALDSVLAQLNGELKQRTGEGLKLEEEGTGWQPDGTYRLTLSTVMIDDLPALADTIAGLVAATVGKGTVRVQVLHANRTICDIAA
jgi:hypothetical protein